MLRSETMSQYKIVVPKENSWEVLNQFGTLGSIEFVPPEHHHPETDKRGHKLIKQCEEVSRTIAYIYDFLRDSSANVKFCTDYQIYLNNLPVIVRSSGLQPKNYFEHVAETVRRFNEDIAKHTQAISKLKDDLIRAEEELIVSKNFETEIPSNYV